MTGADLFAAWLAEDERRSCRVHHWSLKYIVRLDINIGYRKKTRHYYGEAIDLDAAIRAALEKAKGKS